MDPQVYPADSNAPKPPYVMLSEKGVENPASTVHPPPYRRIVPLYPSKHRRSACACSCLCCLCFCSCLFILTVAIFITLLYAVYIAYDPQIPTYKVQRLEVTAFDLLPDFSLHAEFVVAVEAKNPNHHISIIYGEDSFVSVIYKGSELSRGNLPAFPQRSLNKTVMEVRLKGDSPFGSGLQEALMDNRESKTIPLVVFVHVPVMIGMEGTKLKLGPVRVRVVCHLVVDNLSPNEKINILKSDYNVGIE